uniref:Uncharacterized protein n=1 Tax=Toxoplasma gondii COUG TaxID=1074873 RepID=A0A2G8XUR5_TOXGO|nr:hypothetical protein TGCOUG_220900 [Toxoplasma gondii COUG]
MALNITAPPSPLASDTVTSPAAGKPREDSLPASPVAAVSRGSSFPASPSSAAGRTETAPKAEDSPKAGSRRPSFLSLKKKRTEQGNEADNAEEPRQSRRNSFANKAKALLGKATKGDSKSVNDDEVDSTSAAAEASEKTEELATSPKAESRTDKWRRRLSLSRDRSVERGLTANEEGTAGVKGLGSEPASPQNDTPESRLGRLKRRLSLSKDGDRSRRQSHVAEAENGKANEGEQSEKQDEAANSQETPADVSAVKEEAENEPAPTMQVSEAKSQTASPTNEKSESRRDKWRRRLSLSRDCSVERSEKGENMPKSPAADEESSTKRFLRRLSISSRDEKRNSDSEREGEPKEGPLSRLRRRLSISKKEKESEEQAEEGASSEVEKEGRGRRLLRRLSVSSRKSANEEDGEGAQESTAAKLKRRLSLSSRASRASREGSVCSNDGEDKKESSSLRRRLSLRSRSREPPLPCPAGQQTRKSLKEKVKSLVKRRDIRAEDMERVEQLHNPDYKPGAHKIDFASSDEESEREDDCLDKNPSPGLAGNLTEGFAVSSESSPIASVHPETETPHLFPVDEQVTASPMRLETPKDFEEWLHTTAEEDAGVHLTPGDIEETALTVRSPRTEKKQENDNGVFGLFCCGVGSRETEEERRRWKEALRYSCSKMRPQEKVFMQQPLVCRELGFDDIEFSHKLCYAPTEYSLEIEKAF